MAQTSFSNERAVAVAGLLGDSDSGKYARTYRNAEGAGIPFGVAVQLDSTGVISLPDSSGDDIRGITVFTHAHDNQSLADDLGIPDDDACTVLRRGTIWVVCEDGCDEGDSVFYRHTASGAEQLGALRTDADGTDATQISGAEFLTTASAGGLALVSINL